MKNGTTVTQHRKLVEIDEALARGTPVRQVADRYGLSKSSVHRHKGRMAQHLARAPGANSTTARELLDSLRSLQGEAEGILARAKRAGNHREALGAIRESRSIIELLARMVGELQSGNTVSITVSHQWIELRADLMTALEPYPEARAAIMRVVQGHEPNE